MSMTLLRNPATASGLSLIDGDEIRSVDDLPDHRVEQHVFRTSDAAGAFVAGLDLAAVGNALAWTWEPGTDSEANRTVIVARLDEPRIDAGSIVDAVPTIRHEAIVHDSNAHKAAMDRIFSERWEYERKSSEETEPLRKSAEAAGYEVNGFSMDWARIEGALVSFEKDGYVVSMGDFHEGSNDDIRSRYHETTPSGVRYDARKWEFVSDPVPTVADAIRIIGELRIAVAECERMRKEAWHSAFAASMRMTAARRRFLAAADRNGIHLYYLRANQRAVAGGITIKASEIASLVKVGWITVAGGKGEITEAGREAAGLTSARHRLDPAATMMKLDEAKEAPGAGGP